MRVRDVVVGRVAGVGPRIGGAGIGITGGAVPLVPQFDDPAQQRDGHRRPSRPTSRPSMTAENAEPVANGVTASPGCSGVKPRPVWNYTAKTSQIPLNPTKSASPSAAPVA